MHVWGFKTLVEEQTFIDVNIFVYWLGAHQEFGQKARAWIEGIKKPGSGAYATSSITIYEICVIISGLTRRSLRDETSLESEIEPISALIGLKINDMGYEDLKNVLSLMAEYNLDYEDTLHLLKALRYGADRILTNDEDFEGTPLEVVF